MTKTLDNSVPVPPRRTWKRKFRDAFRGLKEGVRGQTSFYVHFVAAALVIIAAWGFGVDFYEWCLLLICICVVLTAEMFNSALETMARAITGQSDPHLGSSLNIGSAAVLVASLGAAVVGAIIFLKHAAMLLGWWPAG